MLRVIEGGLSAATGSGRAPKAEDVQAEAVRRIRAGGYGEAAVRAFMRGEAPPVAQNYRRLQIEFVAATLAALEPIPADFASDRYWPE